MSNYKLKIGSKRKPYTVEVMFNVNDFIIFFNVRSIAPTYF